MPKKLTTKAFIEKAKAIHGDLYYYKVGITNKTVKARFNNSELKKNYRFTVVEI